MHHILIVDDDEAITYSFSRYFEHHGFEVSVANDPYVALQLAAARPLDAVVTDFRMPGMDGAQMLTRLREHSPELPAVIVSGYTSDIDQTAGHTRILAKPVEISVLLNTVKSLLVDAVCVNRENQDA